MPIDFFPTQYGRGLVPRDYSAFPVGYSAGAPTEFPDSLLIPEEQWEERIAEQNANESSIEHVRNRMNGGKPKPSLDQGQVGYCWAHSVTQCVELIRARDNQPYVPLSAYHVAATIKNGRDEGGWCTQAAEFIVKNGVAAQSFWPQGDRNVSQRATAEMKANALAHQVIEFWDYSDDKEKRWHQVVSATLLGIPVATDYNWWSHSVALMRLLGKRKTKILNSWSDKRGDNGAEELEGSKCFPDGAVSPVVSVVSNV